MSELIQELSKLIVSKGILSKEEVDNIIMSYVDANGVINAILEDDLIKKLQEISTIGEESDEKSINVSGVDNSINKILVNELPQDIQDLVYLKFEEIGQETQVVYMTCEKFDDTIELVDNNTKNVASLSVDSDPILYHFFNSYCSEDAINEDFDSGSYATPDNVPGDGGTPTTNAQRLTSMEVGEFLKRGKKYKKGNKILEYKKECIMEDLVSQGYMFEDEDGKDVILGEGEVKTLESYDDVQKLLKTFNESKNPFQKHVLKKILLYEKKYSAEERRQLAKKKFALEDGSFPIVTTNDLKNAIKAASRAKDPIKARKHIINRAKALGKIDLIPDTWDIVTGKKINESLEENIDINEKIQKYIENGSIGDLDLSNSDIEELPDNLIEVNGRLFLSNCKNLKSLNKLRYVKKDLNLINCVSLKNLPDDLEVGESLFLSNTSIEILPDNLTDIYGLLNLSYCKRLKSLNKLRYVKDGANLALCTNLRELNNLEYVGKFLNLAVCKNLKKLPNNLKVKGPLRIDSTSIKKLPSGLEVDGLLNIDSTPIKELPDDLKANAISLNHTPISKNKELLRQYKNKFKIIGLDEDISISENKKQKESKIKLNKKIIIGPSHKLKESNVNKQISNSNKNKKPVGIEIIDWNRFKHMKNVPEAENLYKSGYWNIKKYSKELEDFLKEMNISYSLKYNKINESLINKINESSIGDTVTFIKDIELESDDGEYIFVSNGSVGEIVDIDDTKYVVQYEYNGEYHYITLDEFDYKGKYAIAKLDNDFSINEANTNEFKFKFLIGDTTATNNFIKDLKKQGLKVVKGSNSDGDQLIYKNDNHIGSIVPINNGKRFLLETNLTISNIDHFLKKAISLNKDEK
jgi:hypothetical protein